MKPFKVLLYEDDPAWVQGFEFNISPKLAAKAVELVILHRLDDSTIMQDLEWIPHLILIDHDLGTQVGTDIIAQIDGDPQYANASIYYYSGGESIDALKAYVAGFGCAVYCYIKDGDELEIAVISKGEH